MEINFKQLSFALIIINKLWLNKKLKPPKADKEDLTPMRSEDTAHRVSLKIGSIIELQKNVTVMWNCDNTSLFTFKFPNIENLSPWK